MNIGIAANLQNVLFAQSVALLLLFGFICTAYPNLMQRFLQSVILSKYSGRMFEKKSHTNLKETNSSAE